MTSLAEQEAKILSNLQVIRELWDHMLPHITGIPMGLNGGSRPTGARTSMGKSREDNSDKNTNVTNLDIVMSDRRAITDNLREWGSYYAKTFKITETLPNGSDIHGMCTFLERWTRNITGDHKAADFASAMGWCANRVLRHAKPVEKTVVGDASRERLTGQQRRATQRSMKIASCPIEVPNDDGGQRVCGGDVIAYPDDQTSRDPKCRACGTVAVVNWWMSHTMGNPEAKPLVTADELIGIVVFQLHWTISHAQIRQWAARGKIERAGKDSKGRTLYDHAAVTDAIRGEVARLKGKVGA